MTEIITRVDRDGVAVLVWDDPDRPVNVKSAKAIAALGDMIDAVLADDAVKGYVIASGKSDFIAGGDIEELRQCSKPSEVDALLNPVRALLAKIENGGKSAVAAIRGNALGGGLELALACHGRVAVDTATTKFGQPEITLGLMPGAGGTQRLPRLVGLKQAMQMILTGRAITAGDALAFGLVDQLTDEDGLIDAACALIADGLSPEQWWSRRDHDVDYDPQSAAGRRLFAMQWPVTKARLGEADIAQDAILMSLHHGLERRLDAGLLIEARHFARVASSHAAHNTIRTGFIGMNELRRIPARPAGCDTRSFGRTAVVGAGLMGCGIAYCLAQSGLAVRLIDRDKESAAKGKETILRIAERQQKAGRLSEAGRDAILAKIEPVGPDASLADIDAVIEAVFEDKAVKSEVLQRVSASLKPGALIASNTSTLPNSGLAESLARPDDFLGLHFFAPVERIDLVEVVRGEKTSDRTLAAALDLVKLMRKLPVVVEDGPGFFTSRVLGSYTGEALTMLAEGVDPVLVDNVALAFGMPLGPLHMADLTGIPVLTMIFDSLRANKKSMVGLRAKEALTALKDRGRIGKSTGGIYDHSKDGIARWSGLEALFPTNQAPVSADTIRMRLACAQSLEAVRALEAGVLRAPIDGDVAARLGWRYPLAHGGVFAFIDTMGAENFVAACRKLSTDYGARFDPPALLVGMAERGETFHSV